MFCRKLEISISTRFCGIDLENPFLLAASPCTDDLDMLCRAFDAGWAGAVLKTTSVEGAPVDLAYPMISSIDFAGASTLPSAAAALNLCARARKPIFGSALKIFCVPAVSVVTSSHAVGTSVTHT